MSERRVHCAQHTIHCVCGILVIILAIASALLVADAVAFLILNKEHFALRKEEILTKWKCKKVFGPEHDREVSEYRVLKEITEKNLLRDGVHLLLFITLFLVSLL